jgi:hypothetical protein
MTDMQMLGVAVAAAAVAYNFWPQIQPLIQPQKSGLLADLECITKIRKTYNNADVTAACNKLLEALLQVAK